MAESVLDALKALPRALAVIRK